MIDSPNELKKNHQVIEAIQPLLSVSPPFGYLCDDAKGGGRKFKFWINCQKASDQYHQLMHIARFHNVICIAGLDLEHVCVVSD